MAVPVRMRPTRWGTNDKRYPLERVLAAATLASERNIRSTPELVEALKDADSAVRYWAVIGLLIRGRASVEAARPALVAALADAAPSVRIAVAEGSGQHGRSEDLTRVLEVVMAAAPPDKNGVYVSMQALNAIDALGPNADAIRERVSAILPEDPRSPERTRTNIPKLLRHIAGQKRAGPRV